MNEGNTFFFNMQHDSAWPELSSLPVKKNQTYLLRWASNQLFPPKELQETYFSLPTSEKCVRGYLGEASKAWEESALSSA